MATIKPPQRLIPLFPRGRVYGCWSVPTSVASGRAIVSSVILSEFERAAGMREFSLGERYRVVVFAGPEGWEIHNTDARGRSIDSYPLLSFSDVEDRLSDRPNALAEARLLEEERLARAGSAKPKR
jgi:hypothetical protein